MTAQDRTVQLPVWCLHCDKHFEGGIEDDHECAERPAGHGSSFTTCNEHRKRSKNNEERESERGGTG